VCVPHPQHPIGEIVITCTTDPQIARNLLAEPGHARHAAVIRHAETQLNAAGLPCAETPWTTVHDTPRAALAELDRIAAGAGNYARDRFAQIEIGTAFCLLRSYAVS
jgi:hypothetical protein